MEKLIEVFTEFSPLTNDYSYSYEPGLGFIVMSSDGREHCSPIKECELISKKFGFIKWLVENDKIVDNNAFREYKAYGEGENYYFYLISELAVSDNPIQDLISLLK